MKVHYIVLLTQIETLCCVLSLYLKSQSAPYTKKLSITDCDTQILLWFYQMITALSQLAGILTSTASSYTALIFPNSNNSFDEQDAGSSSEKNPNNIMNAARSIVLHKRQWSITPLHNSCSVNSHIKKQKNTGTLSDTPLKCVLLLRQSVYFLLRCTNCFFDKQGPFYYFFD